MAVDCYTCDQEAKFDTLPARELIGYDTNWRVVHATGSALPGWLVLVPRRHVMELADLTDEESTGLGDWQVRLARALRTEYGVAKTYVMELGEMPGFHLHFHVVPRPTDLAAQLRGPNVFGLLNRTPETGELEPAERDQIAERLAAHLV